MKHRIQAGHEIDVASPDEVRHIVAEGLRSWQTEAVIGVRFPRVSVSATVAGGAFSIGGAAAGAERLGPAPGLVWDVRRLRVIGMAGADVASIYVNDAGPSSLIATTADVANPTGTGGLFTFDRQLVLYPGDTLLVVGSGLAATSGTVTVAAQVQELPVSAVWRLLG